MEDLSSEERANWHRKFTEYIQVNKRSPAAIAWGRLQSAGLGDFAKYNLLQFYAYGESVPAEVAKGLGEINSALDKLKYAIEVVRQRENDPRAEKSRSRLDRTLTSAAIAKWPYRNPQVKTTADASAVYGVIGNQTLNEATADNGKARQNVTRYGGKLLLVILRAGANARGVNLSLTELSDLAYAAGNNPEPLDKNTLQRFFTYEEIQLIETTFQRHFEASEEWDLFDIFEAIKREISQAGREPNDTR